MNNEAKCPWCGTMLTVTNLKTLSREALRSLRGLAGYALRLAPPKAGPGRGHKGKMVNNHANKP